MRKIDIINRCGATVIIFVPFEFCENSLAEDNFNNTFLTKKYFPR